MLTFLLDVNVGKTVRLFLQQQGYQVRSIIEINPRMADAEILRLAHREKSILITCDKDFGDLIFRRHLPHYGVIRLEDTTSHIQIGYLLTILAHHITDMHKNIIVAQHGVIRVRRT
jgi:predicted nuclease of predicted toxin-antitoxin system